MRRCVTVYSTTVAEVEPPRNSSREQSARKHAKFCLFSCTQLDHGADPTMYTGMHATTHGGGTTPLHCAAYNGAIESAKLLLEYGANLHGETRRPLISVVVPVGVADAGKLADKDIMRLGVDVGQFLLSEVCSTVITRGNMYLSVLP